MKRERNSKAALIIGHWDFRLVRVRGFYRSIKGEKGEWILPNLTFLNPWDLASARHSSLNYDLRHRVYNDRIGWKRLPSSPSILL
jgi:hypothetical protein